MAIRDSIASGLDSLATRFSARLGKWAAAFVAAGIEKLLDIIGKKAAPALTPIVQRLEATGKVPPELQPILNEIKNPTGETAAAFGLSAHGPLIGGAIGKVTDALLLPLAYAINRVTSNVILGPAQLYSAELRGTLTSGQVNEYMSWLGYTKEDIEVWRDQFKPRFPSDVVGPVWLHDKAKWEKYWDDVRANGVTEDRIELLKEALVKYPSPAEAIRWMAREVFEPDMSAKYGLDDEFEKIDLNFMEKIGLTPEIVKNHWRAHWEHASWSQVVQMLHRGAMTEQDVYDWFRLVEIPPYWRKGLTATMWELPGRIELRMMAQYGLVDKHFVVELLGKDGLAKEYRDVVADMMMVRGIRTDLQTRYMKGWLDAAGVQAEIDAAGLSPQIATRLYQWIVRNAGPERTAAEKDLTKAEVVKGVKTGVISWEEGIQQLVALGYDPTEANYILAINVEVVSEPAGTELTVRVDTIRRQRRQGIINHDQEVAALLDVGIDAQLAQAYAENDDLRLAKGVEEVP